MPGLSGIDLTHQLRLSAPEIPVVLLTGFVEPGAVVLAEAVGVQRVVQKPITLPDLAAVVASVTSGARRRGDGIVP